MEKSYTGAIDGISSTAFTAAFDQASRRGSYIAMESFKGTVNGVGGFNFEGRPSMYANGKQRFMDGSNKIYACELGRLARELMAATPMLLRRLESLIL
jgi:hypothetical protein